MKPYVRILIFAAAIALLIILLLLIFPERKPEIAGYWKFDEMIIEEKERDDEGRRNYIAGDPGSVTYHNITDFDDIRVRFIAAGNWMNPPRVLIPGDTVEIPYDVSVTDYQPPAFIWSPGVMIEISDTEHTADADGLAERTNYGMLNVRGIPGDRSIRESKNETAVIIVPDIKDEETYYYTIRVSFGSTHASKIFYYRYRWEPGAPSKEDLVSPVVDRDYIVEESTEREVDSVKMLVASLPVVYDHGAVVNYGEELTLRFPQGESAWEDEIQVYRIHPTESPDRSGELLKVYTVAFRSGRSIDGPVEMAMSYAEEVRRGILNTSDGIYIMYFNESNRSWEDVPAWIDPDRQVAVFYAEHFSGYGMWRYPPEPHPEMLLGAAQVRPSQLFRDIDVKGANEFLMRLDRGPAETDVRTGIEMFNEAFDLSSVSTSVLQDIFGVSLFERFNNIAGEIGLAGMFVSLSLKVLDEGLDDRDKLELCSNLMTYASGKWGWQGMQIANIGIFFIHYSLTSFGEAAIAGRHAHWKEKYEEYNRTRNRHIMTQQEWTDFVVETALSSKEFDTVLENRVNQYVNAFFNDDWHDGHLCPDIVRSALVEEERSRLYENELTVAIERMRDGIRERQEKELIRLMGEARDMLNSRLQIRVGVYGGDPDSERVKNLPVRVRVDRDQHLWEGATDNAGQWWLNLTRYGYLHYDSPMIVELDFEGETLTQTLRMETYGGFATVHLYLPEEDQDDIDEQADIYADAQTDMGAWKVATDHLIDPDGNTYTVVTIGNQVWTVENLQTTKYNDGTPIAHVTDRDTWSNHTTGAFCYYDNNPEFGDKYGALYNWHAVSTGKLAPAGWRMPSDADWTQLATYLGGRDLAGGKMKATGTLQGEDGLWQEPNTGATNESGFTGLPGGHRHGFLFFGGLGGGGYWWSATEHGEKAAWRYNLGFGSSQLDRDNNGKTFGFSVRLVRDAN